MKIVFHRIRVCVNRSERSDAIDWVQVYAIEARESSETHIYTYTDEESMYVQVDQKANSHSREQQQQHGRRRGMRSIEHDDDEMMVCSRLEIFVRIMTPFARLVSFNGLCSSRENSDTHHHHHRHHHSNREQRTSIATDRLLFIIVFTLTNVFSSMEAHVTTTERSCLFSRLSRTIYIPMRCSIMHRSQLTPARPPSRYGQDRHRGGRIDTHSETAGI